MPVGSDSVSNRKDTYCIRVGPMADSHLTTLRLKRPPTRKYCVAVRHELLAFVTCWREIEKKIVAAQ